MEIVDIGLFSNAKTASALVSAWLSHYLDLHSFVLGLDYLGVVGGVFG